MKRVDGRQADQMRPVKITPNPLRHAEGSALIEIGETKVLCAASLQDKVPPHRIGSGSGWLTAEYAMLPRCSAQRIVRDGVRGKITGRSQEIQRLIGRSLRAVVDMTNEPPAPRRGCIYWARLDKRRPVLVISPGYRNERASDVIVIPLTSHLREAPTHVRLRRREGGIPEASVCKCEQVTTLPRDFLEDNPLGGALSGHRLAQVERAVLHALGVPVGY